jgi:hypothetical protein
LEFSALDSQRFAASSVEAPHQGVEPLAVFLNGGEIGRSAQQQCLGDAPLEVPVGRFHGTVLVADTAVVACGRHPVVRTQGFVALCEVSAGFNREVLIGRREAVGTVLQGCPAKTPQGPLQPLGQGAEGLPAQNHRDMAPAAVGEPKVVETVLQWLTGDGHRGVLELGEVR